MIRLIYIVVLIVMLVGCEELFYSLVVDNKSNENIDEVKIWFGDQYISNSVLMSGDSMTIVNGNKLHKGMKLTWVDSDKYPHEQVFKTFDFIPRDYNGGNVIFTYKGNDQFILQYYMPRNSFPNIVE